MAANQEPDPRPVDPTTKQPLPRRAQPGYYSGFSTLAQQAFWDDATRSVVLNRVEHTPAITFFSPEERQTIEAIVDRLVPQDDRLESSRIPIVPAIDERLATGTIDGFRFEGMPPDGEAYRLGLAAIDRIAESEHGTRFAALPHRQQDEILQALHDGTPPGEDDTWQRLSVERFWLMLVQDAAEGYYAHPWAWDEIGFGGPAYPRGYFRLEEGLPEPWEVDEQRYEWEAPPDTLSDVYRPLGGTRHHRAPPGQEGTH